jgi:hypothetical protein
MILMTGKTDAEAGKNWMLINSPVDKYPSE